MSIRSRSALRAGAGGQEAALFVADCVRLAKLHGERFKVPAKLRARAREGRPYHAPAAAVA